MLLPLEACLFAPSQMPMLVIFGYRLAMGQLFGRRRCFGIRCRKILIRTMAVSPPKQEAELLDYRPRS
jgi:hypothetical protein